MRRVRSIFVAIVREYDAHDEHLLACAPGDARSGDPPNRGGTLPVASGPGTLVEVALQDEQLGGLGYCGLGYCAASR